jgi:hypothetical protein
MPPEAVNTFLTCVKCAVALYCGLLSLCVLSHLLQRAVRFVWDIKKSQLIGWKIIPAWSTEAHCRQHLLMVQGKHNTYHWGIQWNCSVKQVEKVTCQRMGSVCIAHRYKQRKLFGSKRFVEWMLHTPAFIMFFWHFGQNLLDTVQCC